jgi:hypothetical protein
MEDVEDDNDINDLLIKLGKIKINDKYSPKLKNFLLHANKFWKKIRGTFPKGGTKKEYEWYMDMMYGFYKTTNPCGDNGFGRKRKRSKKRNGKN